MTASWATASGRLSWQVLNEFYAHATRELQVPAPGVRQIVQQLSYWQPVRFGLGLVQRAWHWSDQAGVPYWDSLILAAAEVSGCACLLSEDFQAGRTFSGLMVVNPFDSRPEEFGLS